MSFLELLKTQRVSAVAKKNVIVVKSTETPAQGFEKLHKHNILSAPVFDEAEKKYIGFLDIRDLVSYTVYTYQNRNTIAYATPGPIYHTLVESVTVTYLARRNPFHPVGLDASLYDVAKSLANGAHRVPVVDAEGNLHSIISQSNLIHLFNHHLDALNKEASLMLKDISLGTSPVVSVSRDTSTIETFKLMDNTRKYGVAIVDTDGKLMGNISGKDLKLFIESSSSYDVLNLPIMQFLSLIRSDAIDIRAPTISVNLHETLSIVIKKLAATGVHRLYVVNSSEDYSPVRVVSLTDTLKFVLQNIH
jgi:CBS domain-containing protein